MSAPQILVTGAGGFVGSHLAAGLAAQGCRVTGLDQAFDGPALGRLSRVETATRRLGQDDLNDLNPPDIVVHAAAVTSSPADLGLSAAAHLRANLDPLLALLAAAARWRPKHFVFLSSSGVFSAADGPADLTDRIRPTGDGPYAAAKLAGEILVPAALVGVAQPWVLRLGYLYGPAEAPRPTRRRVSLVQRWWDAAAAGEPLVIPADDPRREWTLVTDLAPALLRLVDGAPVDGPVHLCSPHVLRDSELAAVIAARFADGQVSVGPPTGGQKPPMAPSGIPALAAFRWTAPEVGIAGLAAPEAAA